MLLRYLICMKDAFMEPKRDLYQILHVSKDADVAMITAAYKIRQEQLESKPDIESVNELKLVNWAYVTLRPIRKGDSSARRCSRPGHRL